MGVFSENRKAKFEYYIEKQFNCGIQLFGFEVKSIREGKINISDAYVEVTNGEVFLKNAHISKYKMAFKDSDKDYNEKRPRKLLLKREEINKITGIVDKKGLTVIPLKCYQFKNLIKIEVAICKGKKIYDKREEIKKKDLERESKRNRDDF